MERREAPRVPLKLLVQVRVESVDEFYESYATNLSTGGMFLECEPGWQQDQMIYLQFRLPDGQTLIEGLGRVVHLHPEPHGIGIEFINVDDDSMRFIDSVIERRVQGVSPS
ncbi:MAG: PilZ domain-containing protein [Myxococcota bacterium]